MEISLAPRPVGTRATSRTAGKSVATLFWRRWHKLPLNDAGAAHADCVELSLPPCTVVQVQLTVGFKTMGLVQSRDANDMEEPSSLSCPTLLIFRNAINFAEALSDRVTMP